MRIDNNSSTTIPLSNTAPLNKKKLLEETKIKAQWSKLGLDSRLADEHFTSVKFLCKTRLIYSIVGYQQTTASGAVDHAIKEMINPSTSLPELMIKKEGKWVSVNQVEQELGWDNEEKVLTTPSNPLERWNYFGEGLVPIDRFYHSEEATNPLMPEDNAILHPVAKLSQGEKEAVLARALEFQGTALLDQERAPLNCVIQFVTHPRPFYEKNKLLHNLNAQMGVHCGIRMIMADGSVYSTGMSSTLQEWDQHKGYLGTINGQPTNMDYEEFRSHKGRIVTNIPTTSEDAQKILDYLNVYRQNSIRFNFIKQNCANLAAHVLSLTTGTELNLHVPLNTCLYRALPSVKIIPVIGKPLKALCGKVNDITVAMRAKTPKVIKETFAILGKIIFFIPHTFGLILRNLIFLALGGMTSSPVLPKNVAQPTEMVLKDFPKLMNGLLDEEASDIQHAAIFINWQLQQASTDVHEYSGKPKMNLLPPSTDKEKSYSDKRKAQFQEIYQEAVPV